MKKLNTYLLILVTSFFALFSHIALSAVITKYIICPNPTNISFVDSTVRANFVHSCISVKSNSEILASAFTSMQNACTSTNANYTSMYSTVQSVSNGNTYTNAQCRPTSGINLPLVVSVPASPVGEGYNLSPRFVSGQTSSACGQGQTTNDSGYCEASDPQTACLAQNKFWNTNTNICEVIPTCTGSEIYNGSTNQCELPPSYCVNLSPNPITLSYLASDNAESETLVLKPVSSYEYLAHDGCSYNIIIPAQNLSCFTLNGESSPKKGYCEQSYTPTFQDATNQTQALANITKSAPDSCVGDEISNQFGKCSLVCNVSEFKNTITSTCDAKVSCNTDQTYNETNNTCTNNACPAGKFRPDENSPCQDDVSCGVSELSLQGGCVKQSCPSGQYRTAPTNDCINVPTDQVISTCDWANIETVLQSGSSVSQCMKDAGLNSVLIGGTNKCGYVSGFHNTDNDKDCSPATNDSYTVEYLTEFCNTTSGGVLVSSQSAYAWICANKAEAVKGYSATNNFPLVPTITASTAISTCPINTTVLSNGFCQPDSCVSNPTQSICNSGGTTGGTGDLTETNALLDGTGDIDSLDTKVSAFIQSLDDGFRNGTDANGQTELDTEIMTTLNNFFENSGIKTLYDGYEDINPLIDTENSTCSYAVTWDGVTKDISICDEQDSIHAIISFMLFIGLLYSLRDLIFERPI